MTTLTLTVSPLPGGRKRLIGGGMLPNGDMGDLYKELGPREGFLNLSAEELTPGTYDWDWDNDRLTPRK